MRSTTRVLSGCSSSPSSARISLGRAEAALGLGCGAAQHHEVVRVADELADAVPSAKRRSSSCRKMLASSGEITPP